MDLPAQIKAYEHLGGATGSRIRYRAPRYSARDLFRGPFPVATLNGVPFLLSDLSMSGLCAVDQSGGPSAMAVGDEVAYAFRFGDQAFQEGQAGIVRVDEDAQGRKLGLRFLRGFVDVDQIAKRYREELMRTQIRDSFSDIKGPVPADIKFACLELLSQIRICRTALDSLGNISSTEELDKLISDCAVLLKPHIANIATIANSAIEESLEDTQKLGALKKLFERLIAPEMSLAALWARAHDKPFGYPGDFILMRDMNRTPTREGQAFPALLDLLFRDVFSWIPGRMQALSDMVARELTAQRSLDNIRIMSVGSGGVEELRILIGRGRFSRRVELTLVDQDERALGDAQRTLFEDCADYGGDVSIQCFHASHLQLLPGGELREKLPAQNVILLPSLLDYLRHRPASQLVESLYGLICPGGVLIGGCLRRHPDSARWASELICDWSMIHRAKDEVVALVSGLPRARVDVRNDTYGNNYLLSVRAQRAATP